MKKLVTLAFAVLLVGIVACRKQANDPESQPPGSATVTLTSDEAMRLTLINRRDRTEQDVIKSIAALLPQMATKALTMSITDSVTYSEITKSNDPVVVYVVSDNANSSFVLVPKDNILPAILGYFEGRYDKDNLNPGFEIMLENTIAQFTYMRDSLLLLIGDETYRHTENKLGLIQTKPIDNEAISIPEWDECERFIDREWTEITLNVDPLVKTNWAQGHPYNSEIYKNPATGCTATSAAQIMAYYKFPANSPLDGQPYNWSILPNSTKFYWSDIATNSVGRLFWDLCSDRCLNMIHLFDRWFDVGSFLGSLNCTNTSRTFEIFGYYGGSHQSYNTGAIAGELSMNRPVHICGKAHQLSGWHTWVLDGWREYSQMQEGHIDYYRYGQKVHTVQIPPTILYGGGWSHHNFGWGGTDDGWFGITSKNAGFPIDMEIITGIQPRK